MRRLCGAHAATVREKPSSGSRNLVAAAFSLRSTLNAHLTAGGTSQSGSRRLQPALSDTQAEACGYQEMPPRLGSI
jgi:hypothetical protein